MSLLVVAPRLLESATADLKSIGAELNAAHAAAAAPTTGLAAAGADEVSAAVTALFTEYGQSLSRAQRAGQHVSYPVRAGLERRGRRVRGRGGRERLAAAGRGGDAQSLAAFSPWQPLTGRPLVGNGVNWRVAGGTGAAGGNGGTADGLPATAATAARARPGTPAATAVTPG